MDELNLDDLVPTCIKVRIEGKCYILRSASGGAAVRYRDAVMKAMKMHDGKPSGADGLAATEPFLISLCLYYADANEELPLKKDGTPDNTRLVGLQTITGWDVRVQTRLFDKVHELTPNIMGNEKETVEGLDAKIAELTQRRDALAAAGTDDGGPAKNWPNGSASGSRSHGSLAKTPSS